MDLKFGHLVIPGLGRAAPLDGQHEVVERAFEVLEDELGAGLLQPLAQLRLGLLLEADDGELLASEKPLHLSARLLVLRSTNPEIILLENGHKNGSLVA